jgi:hypothetical protein
MRDLSQQVVDKNMADTTEGSMHAGVEDLLQCRECAQPCMQEVCSK